MILRDYQLSIAASAAVLLKEEAIWKDIPGYEGHYQVSNTGLVKSLRRVVVKKMYGGKIGCYTRNERLKRFDKSEDGYLTVELSLNKNKSRFKVHRLVALVFIENKFNYPVINHIDNNPSNNHVNNLEWTTHSGNALHSSRQGRMVNNYPIRRGSDINTSKLNEAQVKEILKSNLSQRKLANKYSVSKAAIRFIKIKKNWKHVTA